MRLEMMTARIAAAAGVVFFLAAGCRNQKDTGSGHGESEKLAVDGRLERLQGPKISFTEAIRLAGEHERGFVPVAAGVAGMEGAGEGAVYDIALLSRGRVKEVAVDSETGRVTELRERPVREGSEEFATALEQALPSAKIDLSRAVGIAISQAAEEPGTGRALGAQIDWKEGRLIYGIRVAVGASVRDVAINGGTGEVLEIDEGDLTTEFMFRQEYENATRGESSRRPSTELNFDGVPAGLLPDRWRIEATGDGEPLATWRIVSDGTAPSNGNVLALVSVNHDSTSTFNLCWTDEIRFQDGSIEASFKPVSGTDDQGGGLIWRAQGKDDYYVCRANPLEENFRLYAVKAGRRTELASADAAIATGAWHKIRIEHEGVHIRCWLDGEKLIDKIDPTFLDAGGIGFWTKADAVTSFDDLRVNLPGDGRHDDDAMEEDED